MPTPIDSDTLLLASARGANAIAANASMAAEQAMNMDRAADLAAMGVKRIVVIINFSLKNGNKRSGFFASKSIKRHQCHSDYRNRCEVSCQT